MLIRWERLPQYSSAQELGRISVAPCAPRELVLFNIIQADFKRKPSHQ
ncbi:hypothetical protein SLEP1_g41814 [Rubroshorea leprosula]|uniref:Uncharacterized protein n=1 Tax=Rubroshorea leprosula TaxID=152421 RepID=A0AAV5L7X0_9ROSI|nr:hypothetical protein SLEP1_g41814 [Rubroshorea leprosula]